MFPLDWILRAAERIGPHIRQTPLTFDADLGVWLKWENQQVTGSFKARGALNKVLSLERWEQETGLVAASAGNHGQGVALAGQLVNAPVTVFASEHASPLKVEKMRALGAAVRLVQGGYEQAEAAGLHYANEHGKTWVSPYNDAQVIAGQGTIGLEILRQAELPSGTQIVVPVSGGGLIAGIAAALEGRPMRVVGAQAEVAPFMHALLTRGTQENIPDLPSLADGLTGAVEATSITIPIVQQRVNEIFLISEDEIGRAVAYAYQKYGAVIEASAAVSLAAILTGQVKAPAVVIISGGNISKEQHTEICARHAGGNR
jgi:threonine dehydratase